MKIKLLLLLFFIPFYLFSQSESGAMIVSEKYVKSVLKYPSTAKFPAFSQVVEKDGFGGKYIVLGKVKAKNAFGVQAEMVYKVWLTYKSGDDSDKSSWDCTKLILQDVDTEKSSVFYPSGKNKNTYKPAEGKTVLFLGQKCKVTEEGPAFIRIQTQKKYSKSELEKGLKTFDTKKTAIYFHTPGNSARGKEYASYLRDYLFYY